MEEERVRTRGVSYLYLPTLLLDFYGKLVGKYTIHVWYMIYTLKVKAKAIKRIGNFTKSTIVNKVWEFESSKIESFYYFNSWLDFQGSHGGIP